MLLMQINTLVKNVKVIEFPEHDIDLHLELQSIPVRIHSRSINEQIGVCLIESAGVGQATVKLLFVDSPHRKKYLKGIHESIRRVTLHFGFTEMITQRKKSDGTFLTFIKDIVVKYRS